MQDQFQRLAVTDCSFSQSHRGVMVSGEAHVGCGASTFNTLIESACRANSSSTLDMHASVVNNCRYAVYLENNSSAEVSSINVHEGLSEHMVNMFKVFMDLTLKVLDGCFLLRSKIRRKLHPLSIQTSRMSLWSMRVMRKTLSRT